MLAESHSRNVAEMASILALAFRAGISDGGFVIKPATPEEDKLKGFDLIIKHRDRYRGLRVDITDSRRFKGRKIRRTVEFAKNGGRWVYILKVNWIDAVEVVADPCFNPAYDELINGEDGKELALKYACPFHGNKCELAGKLYRFSNQLNSSLLGSETEAREFAMEVSEPPFK